MEKRKKERKKMGKRVELLSNEWKVVKELLKKFPGAMKVADADGLFRYFVASLGMKSFAGMISFARESVQVIFKIIEANPEVVFVLSNALSYQIEGWEDQGKMELHFKVCFFL